MVKRKFKRHKGKRRKGILYEYNGDGQYPKERIKGYMKRYWRKWLKREQDKSTIEGDD